jgi:hypothetical protein
MYRRENIIGYVRGLPRLSEDKQIRAMEQHGIDEIIIDGRRIKLGGRHTVEDWDTLTKKVKAGDTIAVARTRVLVPAEVWRFQRQLTDAFEALESRGTKQKPVTIWDLENDWRSSIRAQRGMMWAVATEDFQRIARYENSGRPPMNWTREEQALIDGHWFNVRRHRTNALAAAAVRDEAKRLGIARLTDVDETNLNGHFGASGRGMVRRKDRS